MATSARCTNGSVATGTLAALLCSACPTLPTLPTPDAGPEPGNGGVLALAGADLAVLEGSRVQLAAEGTRALAGEPLLSWSQVLGAPVLLTNPSSTLPSFVAPLSPAMLGFELRAESNGDVSVDRVTVVVGADVGNGPAFVQVPADAVAEPGGTHTFSVGVAGTPTGVVSMSASACRGGLASVDGTTVTVTLPDVLPCGVVVDAVDEAGRGLAPATRVFWPADTVMPVETRLTRSPFAAPGGSATLSFTADPSSNAYVWAADGTSDVLGGLVEGDQVAFTAPRRRARLAFAGEERRGSASGGVRVAFVEVTDGDLNVAPEASAGDDRIVQPSARFRIDTAGSFDLDGDALELRVTQVLGDVAPPQEGTGVFVAPTMAGILLFHVVADDGTVESAPDTVRVIVSLDAENQRPLVPIAPRRFVAPGQTFTVDGRVAEDPDSGVLSSVTVRQLDDDPVILLDEPVELLATLVAGAAGETYHFEISAFDDQGLGGSAIQEVVVEEAGPYVDPLLGDDVAGTGTAAAPFRTLTGALPTALDHELSELLLAEGEHAPVSVVLPDGLSLRGGLHFDGTDYLPGGGETLLPLIGDGLAVSGGKLAALHLRLDDEGSAVAMAGSASLAQCVVEKATGVAGSAVLVAAQANGVIEDTTVQSLVGSFDGGATVVVAPGAVLRVRGGSVTAGDGGDDSTAVLCDHGTLTVESAALSGGQSANQARAVAADHCNVELSAATLVGGTGIAAIGLDAADSVVTVDAASQVTGASAVGDQAMAVRLVGASGSALLGGQLRTAPDGVEIPGAVAISCSQGALALDRAVLTAAGDGARGVIVEGTSLSANESAVTVAGDGVTGVLLVGAGDVLAASLTVAAARALDGDAGFVSLSGCDLTGVDAACSVPAGFVVVDGGSLTAQGSVGGAALVARGAVVRDAVVTVDGPGAAGVRLAGGASTIERTVIDLDAAGGVGIVHAGGLTLSSSFVTARGAIALQSAGPATVRSTTLVSDVDAVDVTAGGSLTIASSALFGEPGLRALAAPPWLAASALAFDDSGTLVVAGAEQVSTAQRLAELGCQTCVVVPATLVDATGHLAVGANALVDAADPDASAVDDIDGETRPQGSGPDIGCDERP
ncbi:MAG: hypothetical protein HYS27_20230 [Deltaproteobacteria bacterium]|nr:hypothetical protein [Deltaproteobacteria bacterium]